MSAQSTALEWIKNKQPQEFFQVADVPGSSSTVRPLLANLLKEPLPIIGRACYNLYYRQPPPTDYYYGEVPPATTHAALVAHAPAGSGLASISALNTLGWTTQSPSVTRVAVPRRGLKPPALQGFGKIFYDYRSNPRRKELSWSEVTLLEAAREEYYWRDKPLKWILANLSLHLPKILHGQPLSPDKLVWAAETERVSTPIWSQQPHLLQERFDEIVPKLADTLFKVRDGTSS